MEASYFRSVSQMKGPWKIQCCCASNWVSSLIRSRTFVRIDGPSFSVVKVGVSAVNGEVGMGQSAARSVKRISIAVLATLEPSSFMVIKN